MPELCEAHVDDTRRDRAERLNIPRTGHDAHFPHDVVSPAAPLQIERDTGVRELGCRTCICRPQDFAHLSARERGAPRGEHRRLVRERLA